MRKFALAVSAVAAFFAVQSPGHRADAAPLGNPTALIGAAEDISIIDNVHCRRGWRHHRATRWYRADGCRRAGAVIVVPGRTRYVIRDGVRVRVGVGSRTGASRTTVRTRATTTVRTRTSTGGGANVNVQSGKRSGGGDAQSGKKGGGGGGADGVKKSQ